MIQLTASTFNTERSASCYVVPSKVVGIGGVENHVFVGDWRWLYLEGGHKIAILDTAENLAKLMDLK